MLIFSIIPLLYGYTKLDHDFTMRFMAFSFDGFNKMENLSNHVIFKSL